MGSTVQDAIVIGSDEEDEEQASYGTIYKVLVIGEPIPKPSPRFHAIQCTNRGRHFIKRWTNNPAEQSMHHFREEARRQLHAQSSGTFPIIPDAPVTVVAWFCKRPPDSMFVNRDRSRPKPELLNQGRPCVRVMKPDTDNCLKFILDALSTVGWKDDYQVATIVAHRTYDSIPPYNGRTAIEFMPALTIDTKALPDWANQPANLATNNRNNHHGH